MAAEHLRPLPLVSPGQENLCPDAAFTGWDADGGYAGFATVPKGYAYLLADALDDVNAAPLLCAGIVGHLALRRSALPTGDRLGIYGFGASAHIVAQVAIAERATVHVLTRSAEARALARSRLGIGRPRPRRAARAVGLRGAVHPRG